MNCKYCDTKLFENDRKCPSCGAPIKQSLDRKENTFGQFIKKIENNNPSTNDITNIFVTPDPLHLSRNRVEQITALAFGSRGTFNVTTLCEFESCKEIVVSNSGQVSLSKETKPGEYKIKIIYKDFYDTCIVFVE